MLKLLKNRWFSTMKIPIEAIKKLRDETSAPIGQCKTALQQTNCDHQAAMAWLKQKGLVQAEKRQDKETREGVIGAMVTACRTKVALVEINSETDFVAKNQLVVNFATNLMARAIQQPNILSLDKQEHKQKIAQFLKNAASTQLFPEEKQIKTVDEQLKIMISRLQQNIRVRRIITLHSDNKKYGVYVHQGYNQFVGLQAAVAQFEVQPDLDAENEEQVGAFGQFADNIATQLVGSPPKYLRLDQVPEQTVTDLTQKIKKQLAERLSKAPAHAHQKMIKGKLNSYYQQLVLPKMPYVLSNDGVPVEKYWAQTETELSKRFVITDGFVWKCK